MLLVHRHRYVQIVSYRIVGKDMRVEKGDNLYLRWHRKLDIGRVEIYLDILVCMVPYTINLIYFLEN